MDTKRHDNHEWWTSEEAALSCCDVSYFTEKVLLRTISDGAPPYRRVEVCGVPETRRDMPAVALAIGWATRAGQTKG
jgi:hypothetical protein